MEGMAPLQRKLRSPFHRGDLGLPKKGGLNELEREPMSAAGQPIL